MGRVMMGFGVLASVALAIMLAQVSPTPQTATGMTDMERQRIQSVVRDYVLDHGEMLPEAMERYERKQVTALLDQARPELETPFYGAVGGNRRGDVTLVVFFDFRCPYCHSARKDIDALIARDSGLRVVYRDFPVLDAPGRPPLSRAAAQLALAAAQQNRYVAFHDAVFDGPRPLTQESLVAAARRAGLNELAAANAARNPDVVEAINRNLELGQLLGVSGTPTYVIGPHVLSGADKARLLPDYIAQLRKGRRA
jgi:protein-disulfide isomerase